mgnify:CR=1 FL=1
MPETLPDKEATLLIYCRSGRRSKDAAQKLLALGYQSVCDFDTILIVQTQFKVMVDDGQLEPDGLQPLSIRLAFRQICTSSIKISTSLRRSASVMVA